MKFQHYLNEYTHYKEEDRNTTTKYKDGNEMAEEIGKEIQKIFPKSAVLSRFSKNLTTGITVYFTLGKDKSEYANGISHNDPMHMTIFIGTGEFGEQGEIPNKLQLDISHAGVLHLDNFAKKIKFGWRNKKGSPEQIVKTIVDYFKKARKIYDENKDKVPEVVRDK